ncbi:UDP-N-acetylmuramoyl-tripeptide--D-alanyl-D-alanine ligase [Hespellia stercorisuis]|uniref:UDP-N-acetylmuramoyl-tripeptide--D-alanyl-D-alanine ligase n=1 Tax=Hespellia stercorisuis DSM 15480 TaxID=1121950 RepID=A0A1M6QMG5_9FIRM|nr:UDP-N-acetylmuramoyl-tripeptide--D-alanyl-D-alanine ligase [Hespellia stercorisuis]SHK21227.1 UDP-N-acetylmuramoyl-tripeptide--D-alanyl-D-alanine ligase [Hespellia stercorisuis DSM 15480]
MRNMSLKEIAVACAGVYYGDEDSYYKEVSGVTIDSRKIEKDNLFVAIRGARVDGHMFINQVIQDGALCAISEKRIEGAKFPYILVNSGEQALKDIAEHYRRSFHRLKVVGISGSVGKTSTKEMIGSVLEQKYSVLKTAGNFNNEIGLPLTIFNIREEHEIAILEMGISDFGEMERLARMARPDICVLTNIGCAHLEQLKTREGILKAKTEMFQFMNPEGTVILNGDDDMLATVTAVHKKTPQFFGLSSDRDFYADEVENLGLKGTTCTIHTPQGAFRATVSIPGEHMVYNALAGAAVGCALGLTCEQIKTGIEALVPISGRNNLIETDSLTIIDDCYNANPASMKASIDVLSKAGTRKVAILGGMYELGSIEHEMHYETGIHAARLGIDLVCCIGDLAKGIADGVNAVPSATRAKHFDTKEEFLAECCQFLHKGDTILVKASHCMEFPKIVDALQKLEL